jgi:hypothetical protein
MPRLQGGVKHFPLPGGVPRCRQFANGGAHRVTILDVGIRSPVSRVAVFGIDVTIFVTRTRRVAAVGTSTSSALK